MNALLLIAQLTIQLHAPAQTPAHAAIHVAGSFNAWNPSGADYRLEKAQGYFTITLPDSVRGAVEFKFTLGSWQTVETDAAGSDVANRTFVVPATGKATYVARVPAWRDPATIKPRTPSASSSVSILATDFAMPQLGRARRIWIYLPRDYATSNKRYPVLYMHDGQNVFDDATSFAGEWGVDEALDSLRHAGIVVAIDNGQTHRIDEYSPWRNARHGGGEGDAYADFLVHTLKPHIDRRYRTRPEPEHTAIAGSSMGGLISLYAALKYPSVFGQAGIFSPAFWIAPEIVTYTRAATLPVRPRLYFVTAKIEAQHPPQLAVTEPLMRALATAGYVENRDMFNLVTPDGAHSEWYWRREFPAFYRWLVSTPSHR